MGVIGYSNRRFSSRLGNCPSLTTPLVSIHILNHKLSSRMAPPFLLGAAMALSATIYKADLSISDMDRHYYASHVLTLARHPSETEERLMVRLLAFMLYASERLEFGRGLSDVDEPALCRKAYSGEIELWIDVGLPDETRLRKACSQSRRVIVLAYGGSAAELWWSKIAPALTRHDNLSVLVIAPTDLAALTAFCTRNMTLQCLMQDGELQIIHGSTTLSIRPDARRGEYAVE